MSSAMDKAVEAGDAARRAVIDSCPTQEYHDGRCFCGEITESPHGFKARDTAFLRAALPHLLAAVVAQLGGGYALAVLEDGRWSDVVPRDRLLAALQQAAGRL